MSTDWNVHCLDCSETHGFDGANWCDVDMALLCKHSAAIAALAPLMAETRQLDLELRTMYGRVEVPWFVAHAGHRLVPISEYGHFMGQCAEYVTCACGSRQRCTLSVGHDGEHVRAVESVAREHAAAGDREVKRVKTFPPSALTLSASPHHAWACTGCGGRMLLPHGDPRLAVSRAPRCTLCSEFMVPINPDIVPQKPS